MTRRLPVDELKSELHPEAQTNGSAPVLDKVQFQKLLQDVPAKLRGKLKAKGVEDRSKWIYVRIRELIEGGVPLEVVHPVMCNTPVVQDKYDGRNISAEIWRDIETATKNGAVAKQASTTKPKAARRLHVVSEPEPLAPRLSEPQWRTVSDALRYPVPEPQWLIDQIITERSFGLLAGRFKLGKSLIATDLGLSIATGTKFLNKFNVLRRGRVLMVQSDMDPGIVDKRVEYIAHSKEALPDARWVDNETIRFQGGAADHFQYVTRRSFNFAIESEVDWIVDEIDKQDAELVIFDSLYRMMTGDINSAADMTGVIYVIDQIIDEFGCSVLLIHNNRKASTDPKRRSESPAEDMFGSSMLLNAFDDGMFISGTKEDAVHVHREGRRVADNFEVELFDKEEGYAPMVRTKDDIPTEEPKKGRSHHRATARTERQKELCDWVKASPGKYSCLEVAEKFGLTKRRAQVLAKEFDLPVRRPRGGRPEHRT